MLLNRFNLKLQSNTTSFFNNFCTIKLFGFICTLSFLQREQTFSSKGGWFSCILVLDVPLLEQRCTVEDSQSKDGVSCQSFIELCLDVHEEYRQAGVNATLRISHCTSNLKPSKGR